MTRLAIEADEAQWLVDIIGALNQWPPEGAEWALRVIPADQQSDDACGPMLRLRLIQAHVHGLPYVEVSIQELWFLDLVLAQFNTRYTRTTRDGDGRALIELQTKIWNALLDVYRDELPSVAEQRSVADDIEQWLKGGE